MKNILYVVSSLQKSGPINILYNIIKELNKDNFNPIILSLSNIDKNKISAQNDFKNINTNIHSLNLTRLSGFIFGRYRISKFCKSYNVQIIHLIGFRADLLVQGKSFKNYVLISSIFSNLFDDYSMLYGNIKGNLMAHLHLLSLKSKIKVACSNFVKTELRKWVDSDFHVIRNGVSSEKFKIPTLILKNNNRKKLNIDINKKVFIFVGLLIHRKDPLTTIKAFLASNIYKNNEAVLIILGDGLLRDKCEELCKNIDSIKFMGNTSETLFYLNASDYYISSSQSEGLPTSVVEALGCGLIPILTNIIPHTEITCHYNNWEYLFDIGDIKKLSELIDKVTNEDYNIQSQKSRQIVETIFNSRIMSNNYQNLYNFGFNKIYE